MRILNVISVGLMLLTTVSISYGAEDIRSLQNLERERARLVNMALSADIDNHQRQEKIQKMLVNLVDLERMVMRDDRLLGASHHAVKWAFHSYDLTFISHASMEAGLYIVDFWLEKQGLSTESISNARVGLR